MLDITCTSEAEILVEPLVQLTAREEVFEVLAGNIDAITAAVQVLYRTCVFNRSQVFEKDDRYKQQRLDAIEAIHTIRIAELFLAGSSIQDAIIQARSSSELYFRMTNHASYQNLFERIESTGGKQRFIAYGIDSVLNKIEG